MNFVLKKRYQGRIRWSRRGSCGNPGCKDSECGCSLCGKPIGVSEDDPRWDDHDDWCGDCELCRDQVPLILFHGEGKRVEQAQFCHACAEKILFFQTGCTAGKES